MARIKNNGNDGNNEAEIEVFYFKGKNVSGDLAATLTALANTIRPASAQVIPLQQPSQIESRQSTSNGSGQQASPLDETSGNEDSSVTSSTPKTEQRERKPFKGKILDDIAWDGNGTSFTDYMKQRKAEDTTKKFLVIASWFKRHGGHEAVSSNLIYNGYRKMSWAALADMAQPLRDGARSKSGYYLSKGKGLYAITNIGLDAADKVGGEHPEADNKSGTL